MLNSRHFLAMLTAIGWSWFVIASFAAEDQPAPTQETEATPTQRPDTPKGVNLWQPGDSGQRLLIHGWVRGSDGEPIVGAVVNVWQADGNGQYHESRYRASLTTSKDGKYGFGTVLPGQYYGVKHIHVLVTHQDYAPLETQILFIGDPHLDESTQRDLAIFLEDATVKGETMLYGQFDIVMQPTGG